MDAVHHLFDVEDSDERIGLLNSYYKARQKDFSDRNKIATISNSNE